MQRSQTARFSRHANVGDAILIIDLGHRRKTKVGVKGLQVRLRPEVNRLLRPVLLTAGQRLLHQLIAELRTAGSGLTMTRPITTGANSSSLLRIRA